MSARFGLGVFAALQLLASPAGAQVVESEIQTRLCRGMPMNRHLPSGAEVDCIGPQHAIEVEFSRKWAEAIGQSLHYAAVLDLRPGIVLVCRPGDADGCLRDRLRLEQTVTAWKLPLTLWLCEAGDEVLASCGRMEFGVAPAPAL